MNQELELIAHRLTQATTPEEAFGELKAADDEMLALLQKNYRAIAKIAHPDMYRNEQEQALAQKTFTLLSQWFQRAKEKIIRGEYGKRVDELICLRTRTREYWVQATHTEQPFFNTYSCSFMEKGALHPAILKIVRDPRDNYLLEHEATALQIFSHHPDSRKFAPYIPTLLDAFLYEDEHVDRQAIILEMSGGWHSLEEVHNAYPDGIEPKDMAWMWRRLLVVLGFSHLNNVVHGTVLPNSIWIRPQEHGLLLMNWHCAVFDSFMTGQYLETVDRKYQSWYPAEILNQETPLFGTDIQMSAECMIWLLGGDPRKKVLPDSVPTPLKTFLKGCILPGTRAPQNAWALKEEFDELIGRLWGERKFHPFIMK